MLPYSDIPKYSAAFGKRPRSTIPKEKLLFEYVIESSGKHRLERMQEGEYAARNSTSQSLDVLPSVSKLSSCNGVNLLQVPNFLKAGCCVKIYITVNSTVYQRVKW